jgi:hypothetical protein
VLGAPGCAGALEPLATSAAASNAQPNSAIVIARIRRGDSQA